ncbi:phosphotransferase [Pseudomonas sp.]|uniref:aminoglycoside phosphotransferase family protein n=1 Tax=Pseudomonas sp. TaxID=306 RepID=UPI0026124245|nr:phosphotransferase [Pseudomonas sp.]
MPDQDVRLQQLKVWLDEQLETLFAKLGCGPVPPATLTAASSDASFRRYFRWKSADRSFIVMDAPPPQENCRPFVEIAELLRSTSINVPKIYAQDLERGFLLLNDLGDKTFLDEINEQNADKFFSDAIEALLAFQLLPTTGALPRYDTALLRRELELFPEWYVRRHLGVEFDQHQQALWQRMSTLLINSALGQHQVVVHRDFMPRNLMVSTPNPGVLDFQDAVYGPVTYDITSLFKDAFLSWPEERVNGWLRNYWKLALPLGIPVGPSFEQFLRDSDLMGVQRHLKVIGIFARICHRDGKPRYLADVPRFFTYIETVVSRRPELAELGELFTSLRQTARVPS